MAFSLIIGDNLNDFSWGSIYKHFKLTKELWPGFSPNFQYGFVSELGWLYTDFVTWKKTHYSKCEQSIELIPPLTHNAVKNRISGI